MKAVAIRGGVIRARIVGVKALASALSIGTGGSVGREGPIVQIGSAFGSTIGQKLRLNAAGVRTLVGCGAAAGTSQAWTDAMSEQIATTVRGGIVVITKNACIADGMVI